MLRLIHNITVKVFEKNPDNIQKCLSVFHQLLPIDFEKEKIKIKHEKAEGFFQKIIHILTLKTGKNRHNTLLMKTVLDHLSIVDRKRLIHELPSRIDEEGFFYIRLDKESLLQDHFEITETGDCFHMKIKLAAFPSNPEAFMNTATTLLSQYGKENPDRNKNS